MPEGEYKTPYNVDEGTLSEFEHTLYVKRALALSERLRDILFNFSTAEFIEERVSSQFLVNTEQKRGIARVIRDIAFGSLFMGDIAKILTEQYGVDYESAQGIARMILYQLFTPAADELKKIQREKFAAKMSPSATPPPQSSRPEIKAHSEQPRTGSPTASSQPSSAIPKPIPAQDIRQNTPPIAPWQRQAQKLESPQQPRQEVNTSNVVNLKEGQ